MAPFLEAKCTYKLDSLGRVVAAKRASFSDANCTYNPSIFWSASKAQAAAKMVHFSDANYTYNPPVLLVALQALSAPEMTSFTDPYGSYNLSILEVV